MITLLNGDTWGREEILAQMYSDEFYYGHLGKYALSSSSLKTVLKSPKTYRNVLKYGNNVDSPALRAGKLLHWMILEPNTLNKKVFVDVTTRTTKVYKEALAEHGEVYLQSERSAAERLADALLRNEAALELLNKAEFEIPEIAMIDGLPFRGKADILKDDSIIDLKTSQNLNAFRYSCDQYSYDLQAWIYLKMFNKKKFTFLVIDKGSCDIGIFETSKEFLSKGKEKFNQAVSNYKYFFEQNHDLDQYVLRDIL
tara:strand:- start:107 stop:871 length:765 start_codon:yes stop_codon:yes gene_type:complete